MKLNNEIVTGKAKQFGFDLVGFARAEELISEVQRLEEWLSRNYNSGMKYMERNVDKRGNPELILENAKSVISLAKNYFVDDKFSGDSQFGKISRYAWGNDYHYLLWDMLEKFTCELKNIDPDFDSKYYVDTGPLMDKAWAIKAGLGWMGKHTNVINKEYGSWIFLCTIVTNYEFEYSQQVQDFCGSCTRCIDACPTQAITEEYLLDAGKCISYLTIENKDDIPADFSGKLNNWLFGCDICQEVCPWNLKFQQPTSEKYFYPGEGDKEMLLEDILDMDEQVFKIKFNKKPLSRAKLKGLKRNASFLKNNHLI